MEEEGREIEVAKLGTASKAALKSAFVYIHQKILKCYNGV